jgi:hypothetical protein
MYRGDSFSLFKKVSGVDPDPQESETFCRGSRSITLGFRPSPGSGTDGWSEKITFGRFKYPDQHSADPALEFVLQRRLLLIQWTFPLYFRLTVFSLKPPSWAPGLFRI